jgi:hypothetical protein
VEVLDRTSLEKKPGDTDGRRAHRKTMSERCTVRRPNRHAIRQGVVFHLPSRLKPATSPGLQTWQRPGSRRRRRDLSQRRQGRLRLSEPASEADRQRIASKAVIHRRRVVNVNDHEHAGIDAARAEQRVRSRSWPSALHVRNTSEAVV